MVSSPSDVNMGKSEVSMRILEEISPKQVVWPGEVGGGVGVGASRSVLVVGSGVVRVEWKM